MTNIIGLRELRENMDTYAKRVAKGNSFIVVKRSKPLFKISAVDEDKNWETVIDFTKIRPDGIPADELIERLEKLD